MTSSTASINRINGIDSTAILTRIQPAASPRRPEYRPEYRLTRRGRLVVLVVALLAALAIGVMFAGGSVATGERERLHTIVVAPGDTLWEIASDAADGGDVVTMMHHIEDLNDLSSVDLAVGQRLRVPRS